MPKHLAGVLWDRGTFTLSHMEQTFELDCTELGYLMVFNGIIGSQLKMAGL